MKGLIVLLKEYLMFWVRYVPKGKGKDFMEWGTWCWKDVISDWDNREHRWGKWEKKSQGTRSKSWKYLERTSVDTQHFWGDGRWIRLYLCPQITRKIAFSWGLIEGLPSSSALVVALGVTELFFKIVFCVCFVVCLLFAFFLKIGSLWPLYGEQRQLEHLLHSIAYFSFQNS